MSNLAFCHTCEEGEFKSSGLHKAGRQNSHSGFPFSAGFGKQVEMNLIFEILLCLLKNWAVELTAMALKRRDVKQWLRYHVWALGRHICQFGFSSRRAPNCHSAWRRRGSWRQMVTKKSISCGMSRLRTREWWPTRRTRGSSRFPAPRAGKHTSQNWSAGSPRSTRLKPRSASLIQLIF